MSHPFSPAIAGLVPFSSVDWPGKLAAVLFIAGCPWRCGYCHNPHLQTRHSQYSWDELDAFFQQRRGLLDGVVLSGGEPLAEPCISTVAARLAQHGYALALHTAGIYPQRLLSLLPLLSWVGLDIKSDANGYDALTQRRHSAAPVEQSLQLLLDRGLQFECRTTWHPDWLAEARLLDLAQHLAQRGVKHYAVQRYRQQPNLPPNASLSAGAQAELAGCFESFSYR